ncbi:hypothetical protein [Acidiphilium acidophilum]|uniref:Uncharacterized protein n=1 Tax=Acidiphilium acidophilum TaxID=76588 RepID=A0AAW9DU05_ACIAO|nr:hypothetical protein [Acidiphilium acidophilum]MDX5932699.1 hypothetical protein [Acidiphilium acidophilum]
MATVAVTLGGVAFRDFEIPAEITFGGVQRLAIHQPVGGGRIVDTLGAAATEIGFAGVFSGPDAETRAQTLGIARDAGIALPLVWGGFAYEVVIASFEAAYRKPWWIPFRIALVAVENLVTALPSALVQAGLDIASAAGFAGLSGVSSTAAAGVTAAQTEVSGVITAAGASLDGAVTAFSAGVGAAVPIAAMGAIGASSAMLAGAAAAQAYLGRAVANIGIGAL